MRRSAPTSLLWLRFAWLGVMALSVAVVAGCGEDQAGAAAKPAQAPAPVETAQARAGELEDAWTFVGNVRSLRSAALALGAGGEVVAIEVREGDRVEAGASLVEIDERQAKARVSAAVSSRRESERALAQAKREAERAASLDAIIPGEEIERDAALAEGLAARERRLAAEIRAAKAQLSDYRLIAPFAGVIAARHVDLGQWVDPGQTVLELVADDALEVIVEVRPELAPQLRAGQAATLRPAAGMVGLASAGEPDLCAAEILGVVPSLDPGTRTLKVRLRALEPRGWLVPGAPVEVAFPVRYATGRPEPKPGGGSSSSAATIADAVIIPRDALVLGAVDIRVIVVEDDHATPVLVELRATTADEALVISPELHPGVEVVTRGNERLRPGQAVRRLEPSAPPPDEPAS